METPVSQDYNWRSFIRKEDSSNKEWQQKWSWILTESNHLQNKLNAISKESSFLKEVSRDRPPDLRSIHPVPENVNHDYGWIANKKPFQLQTMGHDLPQPMPMPPIYRVFKPEEHPHVPRTLKN